MIEDIMDEISYVMNFVYLFGVVEIWWWSRVCLWIRVCGLRSVGRILRGMVMVMVEGRDGGLGGWCYVFEVLWNVWYL